jgi:hypothetical protein
MTSAISTVPVSGRLRAFCQRLTVVAVAALNSVSTLKPV